MSLKIIILSLHPRLRVPVPPSCVCTMTICWPQLMLPFYSILFVTSFWQGSSSESFPIMPEEFGEHKTRDQRPFLHPGISPDPSDSQLHVGAFPLQFTLYSFIGFRSGKWDCKMGLHSQTNTCPLPTRHILTLGQNPFGVDY